MEVFLWYFLATLNRNQVEQFGFSSIWDLETVCYHIDTRWDVFYFSKNEFLKRKRVFKTEPTQMSLSQIQKTSCEVFSAFPESTWNLEYFGQRDEAQRWFFFWN